MVNVLQWWDYSYHEVHSLGVLDHQAEQCGAAAGLVSREHHSGTPEFVNQVSYGLENIRLATTDYELTPLSDAVYQLSVA